MDEAPALSFERAEYEDDNASHALCSKCSQALSDEYWRWQETRLLCTACGVKTAQEVAAARASASYFKAVLLGGGAALICGIAYAVFVALTDIQLALATIGIAFVVGSVVRSAANGVGGTSYRVLAVALTYCASAMGYAPAVWAGIKGAQSPQAAEASAAPVEASAVEPASGTIPAEATTSTQAAPVEGTAAQGSTAKSSASGLEIAVGMAVLLAIMLAAPFLAFMDAPIGFLIVLFGLWEAWKFSQGAPVKIEGPFRSRPETGPEPIAI